MNVLHIEFDSLGSPLSGGGALRNIALNSRLVQRGHRVIHLASRYPGCRDRETVHGIHVVRIGKQEFPWNFIWWFCQSGRHARNYENWADIIVDDFTTPIGPSLSPLILRKRPLVGSVQFFNAVEMTRKYCGIPFFALERLLLPLYKNFIVLTPQHERKIRKKVRKARVCIIPNAIDKRDFHVEAHKEENFILFVGRMDIDMKGIDLLFAAVRIAVKQRPAIRLSMIGHGREEKKVRAMIRDLGLSLHVDFVGAVSDKIKFDYIMRSAFVVMPSRYEGFGLVALEAFACSKTLIVFDIENLNQVVTRERGILVQPFSVAEYAAHIVSLWDDPEKRSRLGLKGKEFASGLHWDDIAEQLESFYSRAINEWPS
ncbi:MAG TPA: glycosyltransferase family 4 protein [Syntrophobacteria bacterium]|nr:glycosyltransferase family 4 protein [Syntrophobacteria bacterium]